jgi:hypothetical protein
MPQPMRVKIMGKGGRCYVNLFQIYRKQLNMFALVLAGLGVLRRPIRFAFIV